MGNASEFFNNMTAGMSNAVNCCLLAKVESYDEDKNTITANIISQPNNNPIPALVEVPVMIFGNDNYNIKFKVESGDKVIILLVDYDIDSLILDDSTTQAPTDRTHSINDAIAIPFTFNSLSEDFEPSSMVTINAADDIELNYGTDTIKVSEIVQRIERLESR